MAKHKVAKRRQPNGRAYQAPKTDYAPALIKRSIARALERGEDPALGSALGVMMFRGQITAAMFGAAQQYGYTIGAYDRLAGNANRSVKSPAYHNGRMAGGESEAKRCAGCDCEGVRDCATMLNLKRAYAEMDQVMGLHTTSSPAGPNARWVGPAAVVYRAVVHDERPTSHEDVLALVGALERLAAYVNGERRAA